VSHDRWGGVYEWGGGPACACTHVGMCPCFGQTHHLFYGMGLVINAAPEYQGLFPPPPGFPTCSSFTNTSSAYVQSSRAAWAKLAGGGAGDVDDDGGLAGHGRGVNRMRPVHDVTGAWGEHDTGNLAHTGATGLRRGNGKP
jgi:hypothetical protein